MKLWFGKYKGWEIEDVLKVDPKYLEHIFSVKGLCSENPDAYKEFIKLGGKVDDTREHNKMQIKYEYPIWIHATMQAYLRKYCPDMLAIQQAKYEKEREDQIAEITKKRDAEIEEDCQWGQWKLGDWNRRIQEYNKQIEQLQNKDLWKWMEFKCDPAKFEENAIDVFLWIKAPYSEYVKIECKPAMGDNYPKELREILFKKNKPNVIVLKRYEASITLEEFIKFWGTAGIDIVFWDDIETIYAELIANLPPAPPAWPGVAA